MKNLRELKVDELKEIARGYGAAGVWKMTKDQLISSILKNAKLNGQSDLYCDAQDSVQESQNATHGASESKADKTPIENEEASKRTVEPSDDWELIAKKHLNNAYKKIVGSNESAVADSKMTNEEFNSWIQNEALEEVYYEAITTMQNEYASDMRHPGKDFCYKYLEKLFKRDGYKLQNASRGQSNAEPDSLSVKSKAAPKRNQGLKAYAAWVVDRETKEITTTFGDADCRENFYNSIKTKYRVRLITKPEKLEEECKQWEVKHARNKQLKNEKYAHDKAEAKKKDMTVGEYRKWLRDSAKSDK